MMKWVFAPTTIPTILIWISSDRTARNRTDSYADQRAALAYSDVGSFSFAALMIARNESANTGSTQDFAGHG